MRTRKILTAALLGVAVVLAGLVPAATAAPEPANPQAPKPGAVAVAAAPDQCLLWRKLNTADDLYRLTFNAPRTYSAAGWNNVACGRFAFSVPRGQWALVDLTATAEFDCNGPVNAWCESRFTVNGFPLTHPNNDGRTDTYAQDSANGGNFNWQAHSLAQVYRAVCSGTGTTPCVYTVQLQVRPQNGTPTLWVDDLTVVGDVATGPAGSVSVVSLNP